MAVDSPELLALRALGLGDFLTCVPALRALRRAYPSHELVLACPSPLAPLVSLASVADRLVPAHGVQPLPWSGPAPELAVNLHGKGPESHRVLWKLGPGRMAAFGCAEAGHEGPKWRADEHEVQRWCRMLEESLGIEADSADILLPRPVDSPGATVGAVVIHPGAAFPSRRWPVERFARVARWARDQGLDVVITGSVDEVGIAKELQQRAGFEPSVVMAGRTDLGQLASVISSASLVVCGDTGVAHLATAFATPSVVLFGPISPAIWGPRPDGPHTAIWHGERIGDPWRADSDPALMQITVEEVVVAAERRLAVGVMAG